MPKDKLLHFGKILAENIEKQGVTKQFVMGILKIKHNTTLDQRLEDAKFSYDQLRILRDKNLI